MGKIFEADEFRDMSGNNILDSVLTNPMTADITLYAVWTLV